MNKSAMIRARIEPDLKREVEHIFEKLGLSVTDAISLFYHQVKIQNGLPFDLKIPNDTTLQTFQDTDNGKNLVRCKDLSEMYDKLGI